MANINPGVVSLVAWSTLDEASGVRVDAHGSNDLADINTVTSRAGVIDDAASFDDTNSEYLDIQNDTAMSPGDADFSGGAFVWVDDDVDHIIMAKWDSAANKREWQARYDNGTQDFQFRISVDGINETVLTSTLNVSTGQWYYVGFSHNAATNMMYLYVDANAYSGAHVGGANDDSPSDFMVGAAGVHGTPLKTMDGGIDIMFFYDKYLTADHHSWLRNGGNGRAYSEVAFVSKVVIV